MLIVSCHGVVSYIVGILVNFGFAYFLGIIQLSLKKSEKLKSPECEVLSGDFGYTLPVNGLQNINCMSNVGPRG